MPGWDGSGRDYSEPVYRESRCHGCCKTPGYGCAKNFRCDCHLVKEGRP